MLSLRVSTISRFLGESKWYRKHRKLFPEIADRSLARHSRSTFQCSRQSSRGATPSCIVHYHHCAHILPKNTSANQFNVLLSDGIESFILLQTFVCRAIQRLTSISICLTRIPESGVMDLFLPLVSSTGFVQNADEFFPNDRDWCARPLRGEESRWKA